MKSIQQIVSRTATATAALAAAVVTITPVVTDSPAPGTTSAPTSTPASQSTSPPVSDPDLSREQTIELTVGQDPMAFPVRAAIAPDGAGGDVAFSWHDGAQWFDAAEVAIPMQRTDVLVTGDGSGGFMRYGVLLDEPDEVRGLGEDGQEVSTSFDATPLAGTDLWVIALAGPVDDPRESVETIEWTDPKGATHEVSVQH